MSEGILTGALVGYLLGQILLLFFMDEIFRFLDRLVYSVRNFFNLEK